MKLDRPIGVFDSGIGGLTVVKNIMQNLPNENVIYFGDIARIPYGTKSRATIQKFAAQTVEFLISKDVKAIVIACNTISALAKDIVKDLAGDIPVIDVISAAVSMVSEFNNVGVIATPATINSGAYSSKIHKINPNTKVYEKACGLFVPMIEEGFIVGDIVDAISKEYIESFNDKHIDALILGCTHYPIIKESIQKILKNVELIDPSLQTTNILDKTLKDYSLSNTTGNTNNYSFYVTDIPLSFRKVGEMFLEQKMNHLEMISIDA